MALRACGYRRYSRTDAEGFCRDVYGNATSSYPVRDMASGRYRKTLALGTSAFCHRLIASLSGSKRSQLTNAVSIPWNLTTHVLPAQRRIALTEPIGSALEASSSIPCKLQHCQKGFHFIFPLVFAAITTNECDCLCTVSIRA